ncbi:hypothetical protein A3765_28580 [Oleiphilus sp. HI0130]|nr:hypothetical protein A3765_28865 [Oleiphilus sp. HI0130]KZZ72509.1 hypothetical protein A3765_28580 [Oleiphilus sp. HI0130]
MNKYEREQVDAICFAYWLHVSGVHNDIPKEGKTILADYVELGGVYSSEGYKPELVGAKAERLRNCEETEFMLYASEVFNNIELAQQWILVVEYYYNRRNPSKEKPLTGKQLAEKLGITHDQYRHKKRAGRNMVLGMDKVLRPHVYEVRKIEVEANPS